MNGIDKIINRISGDAQGEIDAILSQARQQGEEISARYEAKARAEVADILERGKRAAAEREERLRSAAKLEQRKAQLAAKQEVIEEASRLALNKLQALPEQEYVSLLADLAAQAVTSRREKLIFSPSDRARLGKAVVLAANERLGEGAMLTLSEESRPMKGGFILQDGAVEVNCTFDTIVRLQREALAGQVASVLFP